MSSQFDRSVAGDNDTWLLLERTTPEGYPLVVLTRAGNELVERSMRDALITIVECQPEPELINERGMPQHTDRIYPLEDELNQKLAVSDVRALHVASITGDGVRRILYAHLEPFDFESILKEFEVEGYSLRTANVDDRRALTTIITPTQVDHQLSGDRQVISNLEENGDDGSVPRKTDFWFYGDTAALAKVAEELAPWGYSIDHWLDDPEGVVLTGEIPANDETFREVTPMLVGIAERHGVTYDGWETFVVRADDAPAERKPRSLLGKLFGAKPN